MLYGTRPVSDEAAARLGCWCCHHHRREKQGSVRASEYNTFVIAHTKGTPQHASSTILHTSTAFYHLPCLSTPVRLVSQPPLHLLERSHLCHLLTVICSIQIISKLHLTLHTQYRLQTEMRRVECREATEASEDLLFHVQTDGQVRAVDASHHVLVVGTGLLGVLGNDNTAGRVRHSGVSEVEVWSGAVSGGMEDSC